MINQPVTCVMPHLRWPLLVTTMIALGVGGVACGRDSEQDNTLPERSAVPGPGDSLAKLSRLLLTDSDPRTIKQAILCEHVRLQTLYGPDRMIAISKEVRDTVYKRADREALRGIERVLANSMFDMRCESSRSRVVADSLSRDTTRQQAQESQ